jgi:hypothetical protein
MQLTLNPEEIEVLFRQDPSTRQDGGFQSFLVRLQKKTDKNSGMLLITESDLERIPRYAFKYGNGGWENRLKSIFERHLGYNLGRN